MILRIRSRDGLERVEVNENATVGELKQVMAEKLNIPLMGMGLSKDSTLLTSKTPENFTDLAFESRPLKGLGVAHGDMIFVLYSGERAVQPTVKRSPFDARPFGQHMTSEDIAAKQVRIERQEKADAESLSFDVDAANHFQQYVQNLAFSIKRGGILYGTVDEAKNVRAEFVYEPPQEGTATRLFVNRHTDEEAQVDFIANLLGLKKVGWVFNQSTFERDFIMHAEEIQQVAAMQDEIGDFCVTVIVSWEEPNEDMISGQVHFEVFQCSRQCVQLWKNGWMHPVPESEQPTGIMKMKDPNDPKQKEPVMVSGKDADEVDVDYFLCASKILQHRGPLNVCFPIENRLTPQGKAELRQALTVGGSSRPYVERMADIHLLLWLSKQPNLDAHDITLLCDAIRNKSAVREGYRTIIDSMAGL